ncbi:hypothetical protein KP509_31G060500 [Ceratopteris richardii]|uniref:Uncharacterized protein n=1 Tax=Ceratopteris richardii TaxID=49495 RepID=A0A8T2QYE2_CERRI|nr:hypothetical protein KP509_31G060500 [Ceratopteris richardii]
MQDVCKQIRESRRYSDLPCSNHNGSVSEPVKPLVQRLDLTGVIAPENLKPSTLKSCAKRECLCCESETAKKPLLRLQQGGKKKQWHVGDKQYVMHGSLSLARLPEELKDGNSEENDENHTFSHRWNIDSLSFARYCEGKLEAVLSSHANACNESPDAHRTECCFEVLEEMCQNKLPFSSVLRHICDQLRCATYCPHQNTQEKPFFEVVCELENEIGQMEAENLSWKSTLANQCDELIRARGELEEVGNELWNAEGSSNELVEKLSLTEKAMASEKEKVNMLREKIKELKKELKDIRHLVKCAKEIEATKDKELEDYEKLKALYMQLVHEFQHAQAFLHAAQCEVAESASKKELLHAKAEILDLENKISHVRAQVESFSFETRSLTPRPQWGREVPGMDKPSEITTAEQVQRICRENAFLEATISRLQISFAATEAALKKMQGQKSNRSGAGKKPKLAEIKPKPVESPKPVDKDSQQKDKANRKQVQARGKGKVKPKK